MSHWSRRSLSLFLLLAAAFLSAEIWMQLVLHTSVCTTSACDLVGDYIRLGEGNLIKIGSMFFWLLWGLIFFEGRYDRPWLRAGTTLLLFGALAFDGALLGFQFMGLKVFCLLCALVGGLLAVSLALFSWHRRSFLVLCLGLAAWSGGFAANSTLALSVEAPAVTDTSFLSYNATAPEKGPEHVLFFSLHCDHCLKVLANLAINTQNLSGTWHLSCPDNAGEDFFQLATILDGNATAENPFLEIIRVKGLDTVAPVPVSEELRQSVRTARAYLRMKDFRGVPVLVVIRKPGWEETLRGETNIMNYLREQKFFTREIHFPEVQPPPADNATAH